MTCENEQCCVGSIVVAIHAPPETLPDSVTEILQQAMRPGARMRLVCADGAYTDIWKCYVQCLGAYRFVICF